jgi:hypothetical protein
MAEGMDVASRKGHEALVCQPQQTPFGHSEMQFCRAYTIEHQKQ